MSAPCRVRLPPHAVAQLLAVPAGGVLELTLDGSITVAAQFSFTGAFRNRLAQVADRCG